MESTDNRFIRAPKNFEDELVASGEFHKHLDQCLQCHDHPFDLCLVGARLLEACATKEQTTIHPIPEKIAPVQGYSAGIPWSMHLRAYDAYCKKYGRQDALIDLEGRNCRGGFGVDELDVFIPGWREELSEIAQLRASLLEMRTALEEYRKRDCRACAPLIPHSFSDADILNKTLMEQYRCDLCKRTDAVLEATNGRDV